MGRKKKVRIDIGEKLFDELLALFRDEYGQQLFFSPTQKEMIRCIAFKPHPRVGVICPTQYGKSTATACGIIIRAIALPEKFTIIGGTSSKAEIIMGYIIDHLFDSEIFTSQLKVDVGLDRLRRERRRDHLTFRRGGEIKILSAEYRNRKRLGEALIGEGSQNVIIDDSVLCDDDQYAYIRRMVGGRKDSFIFELANPLRRNHFYKTMTTDRRYHKIWIDWRVAVQEGRFTQEFIDEMREQMFFDVFYECKFPAADAIDEKGYIYLFPTEIIEPAISQSHLPLEGTIKLGQDVAQGGALNVICLRGDNYAKFVNKNRDKDLMKQVGLTKELSSQYNIIAENIAIDDTGVGAGVSSRLKEQGFEVNAVKFGASSSDKRFVNKRAEMYWKAMEWMKAGGKIENDFSLITQLKEIRYKVVDSSGAIQIEPKEAIIMRLGASPDEADAFALTFAEMDDNERTYLKIADWDTSPLRT